MKMAEERSDDEDIFSCSMQTSLTVELPENNECTTKSHNSDIDSDDEIDEFIRSSQSPTREIVPANFTNKINDLICCKDVKNSIFHERLKGGLGNSSKHCTERKHDLGTLSRAIPGTQDYCGTEDNTFSQDGYQLSLELPSTQNFDMQIRQAGESSKNYEQEIYPLSLALPSTQDFDGQVQAALDCNTCSQDTPDLLHPKHINETFDLSLRSYDYSNSYLIEENSCISRKDNKTILSNDSKPDFIVERNHSIRLNLEQAQFLSKSASTTPNCSISSCDTEPYEMDNMFESQNKNSALIEIINEKFNKQPEPFDTINSKDEFCTKSHNLSPSQETELTNSNIDNEFIKNRHVDEDSSNPSNFQLHKSSGLNSPSLLQEEDYTDNIYNKTIFNSGVNKKIGDNDSSDSNVERREYSEPNSPSLLEEGDYSGKFENIKKSADVTNKLAKECTKKYFVEESQPHPCNGPNSPSLMDEDYSDEVSCIKYVKSVENVSSYAQGKSNNKEPVDCASSAGGEDFDMLTQISIIDKSAAMCIDGVNVSTANVPTNTKVKSKNQDKELVHCGSSADDEDFDVLTQISIIDKSAAMCIDDVNVSTANVPTNTKVKSKNQDKELVHCGSSADDEDFDVLTQISNIDQSAAMCIVDVDFESCTEGMSTVERHPKNISKDLEIDNSADETQVDFDIATQEAIEAKHNNSANDTDIDFEVKVSTQVIPVKLETPTSNTVFNDVDFVAATQVSPSMQANRRNVDFKTPTQVEPILERNDVNPAWEIEVDFEIATQVMPITGAKEDNTEFDFEEATQVIPTVEFNSPAKMIDCNDIGFVVASQVSPATQANKRNFDDVDFKTPIPVKPSEGYPDREIEVDLKVATQVVPIAEGKDDNTKVKSDFDNIDFEAATQVIPVISKKIKSPASELLRELEVTPVTQANSEVKNVDSKSDFEVATQGMPITGVKDDGSEIDFEATQANGRNLDDVDFKTSTQVVRTLKANDVNPAEEIEVDFEGATQAMPITEAIVNNTGVQSDFDNIDFEAATQMIPVPPIKFKFPASKPDFDKMEDVPAPEVTPITQGSTVATEAEVKHFEGTTTTAKSNFVCCVLPAVKVTSNLQLNKRNFDNVDFKVPTIVGPNVKTNVDKSAVKLKDSDIYCSSAIDDDFEAGTQERVRNREDARNFDDVDFEIATQVNPTPPVNLNCFTRKTDFVALSKLTSTITSNIHNFNEVPKVKENEYNANLDGVNFEAATQVLSNTEENVKTHDNETDFDDIDFLAPTQVTPIIHSNLNVIDFKAPSQVVSMVKEKVNVIQLEFKTDSEGINFEAATQILPKIKAKVKNNEEKSNLGGVDFEACTQAMADKGVDLDIEVFSQVLPKMEGNVKKPDHETDFDDIDFLAPTQVATDIGANVINCVNKSTGGFEVTVRKSDNKNSCDDIDFEACTQVIHITPVKKNPVNKLNLDDDTPTQTMPSLKKKSSDFDDVDFEACTQVGSNVKGSQGHMLHLNENRLAAKVIPAYSETAKKYDHVTNDPKSTLNSINDDDSTDYEEEESLRCCTRVDSSSLGKIKNTKSLNINRHLPTPPEDVESCDNAMNENSVENEEEAYMLPTQLDSQSMCYSENQNNTTKQTSELGANNKLVEPLNSDSSNELPSTPEFDRQLAEAEAAFNDANKRKTITKRSHLNSSELEFSTRRTKRRRKMTWKMNELLNLNSNSSESFCNTSDDNSNSTPASSRSIKPATRTNIRIPPSPVPLIIVNPDETGSKYNTRLSLRKRKSLENTPKVRHKSCLRRKRARIIDSESGDENENPEPNTYCVAFAVNPTPSYRSTIQYLGGNIVEVNEANVFICDKFRRTIKVMSALSNGIPMVTSKWILECKRYQRWLDTSNYILKDEGAEKKWKFTLQKSLKKAGASKLLSGYVVFTTPNVTPRASEICKLVESCGGCNINVIPRVWPTKSFVISCRADVHRWPTVPTHVKIVEVQFVINSIIHQKLDFSQLILK